MEIFVGLVTILLVVFLGFITLVFIFSVILEPAYIIVFNRPVYVHFYLNKKQLEPSQHGVLHQFSFYRNLSPQKKSYFRHRVHEFTSNYKFIGRGGLEVTEQMKTRVAATGIMLTFGMRNYLPVVFDAIILYPDIFESPKGGYHKGEFNLSAKAIVFSWKHFEEGLLFENDNVNLGLHEFAHALHFDSMSRRRIGSSSVIYTDYYREVMDYFANPKRRQQIMEANYFREYAYTNQHEFIAVILEYLFESPKDFKARLPELYKRVTRMINYKERWQ